MTPLPPHRTWHPAHAPRLSRPVATVLALGLSLAAAAQINPDRSANRPNAQDISQRDTAAAQTLSELPDSIILYRYAPARPSLQLPVADSALDLRYVRYDPVTRYGPDYVYLNNLVQPAALNPLLGGGYRRDRRLLQPTHPAYEPPPEPFLGLNVPYAYTAYNQGGEIDDGQIDVLFGAPFANGWNVGVSYLRTYQSGARNRYPQAQGERIQLGATVSYVPDSAHHRAYVSLAQGSWGFFNPGGYTFAVDDSLGVPDAPFLADPQLDNYRTEGSYSEYAYRHRYFLREQLSPKPVGWAGTVRVSRERRAQRTAGPTTLTDTIDGPLVSLDLTSGYGPLRPFEIADRFGVGKAREDRGNRYAVESETVLAKADLEYFTDADAANVVAFDLRAGLYGGRQEFAAEFYDGRDTEQLFGVTGEVRGEVARQFRLDARGDFALGSRAGQGRLEGSLSWDYRDRFEVEAFALLERSDAPWAATTVGVNDVTLTRARLPVSTHTRLGGAVRYARYAAEVKAYLEVFADGWVYDTLGFARPARTNPAIPTLEYSGHLGYGMLQVDARGVLRSDVVSDEVYLPAFTGQQSVYLEADVFRRALTLMVGLDSWVRSPVELYGFQPLTNVFHLATPTRTADWQYSVDAFLAFKVQSFKAFVRLENALASRDEGVPPSTVAGYPLVRGPEGLLYGELFRFGISWSLYN